MKGLFRSLIVMAVLAGVLIYTCPKEDAHKTAVKENLISAIDAEKVDHSLAGMVVNVIKDKLVGGVADNMLRVDDYYVFSVGRVEVNGGSKIVSVGVLGHVFTPDIKKLDKFTSAIEYDKQ